MNANILHADNLLKLVAFIRNNTSGLQPQQIVELGARDCMETLSLHSQYPAARILTFECNPDKVQECRDRVKGIKEITLVEKAVSNETGTISFFQIDTEKTETTWKDGNPGASSLFKATGNYSQEKYVQKEVKVECTTLYEELPKHKAEKIDLLWMDIQGSELNALKGLGSKLANVSVIHTEVEFMEIYQGQPLFWEVKQFLNQKGFYLATFTSFYKNNAADAVFINKQQLGFLQKIKYYLTNKTLHLLYHYNIISA